NSLMVFTAAGLGMASPYLLLSANPAWLRFVPKPGNWMITFKQSMGFVLLATAVWLLWVLRKQVGADGLVAAITFFGFLGLSCWLVGKITLNSSPARGIATWITAGAIAFGGYCFGFRYLYDPAARAAHPLAELAAIDINNEAQLAKL